MELDSPLPVATSGSLWFTPMTAAVTRWDIGDPEPPESVLSVRDLIDDDDSDGCSPHWGRTYDGAWKGYKGGNSRYLSWQELLRRWGPVES